MSDGLVVLVNGSSASGKSTLIGCAERRSRELAVVGGLRCALRATTRPARDSESLPAENRYLDPAAFEREARAGALDVHWRRALGGGRELRYGFSAAAELEGGGVVLLSANNYLDWTAQPLLRELRAEGRLLVVRVWASRETRAARLAARTPALSATELASRLDDVPAALLPPADHVVPNDRHLEAHAEWDLLRRLAAFRFSAPVTAAAMAAVVGEPFPAILERAS